MVAGALHTVGQGDVDSRRLGEWAVFEGASSAERGAFGAVSSTAAPAKVKRGKMAIG